ncbi:MAG: hypothetical protein M3O30_06135 [Planctomycetota bacterium]|nr:hypothetical protein [Planctomycetota bacterium]
MKMKTGWLGLFLVSLAAGAPVLAQTAGDKAAQPATVPSLTPAQQRGAASLPSVNEDMLTPLGTIKVLRSAVLKGDALSLSNIIHGKDDKQNKVIKAFAYNNAAKAGLRAALYNRFPDPARDPVALANKQIDASNPQIDAMTETVTGDEAVVKDPNAKAASPEMDQLHFVRIDGQWKIPFESIFPPGSTPDLAGVVQTLNVESGVYDNVAFDVSASKFATFDEAMQTLKKRMIQAVVAAASTQPSAAGKPATRP